MTESWLLAERWEAGTSLTSFPRTVTLDVRVVPFWRAGSAFTAKDSSHFAPAAREDDDEEEDDTLLDCEEAPPMSASHFDSCTKVMRPFVSRLRASGGIGRQLLGRM